MKLNIGDHLIAQNITTNQIYNTQIIKITYTYYICKKIRTLIDDANNKELLYFTDEQLNIDRHYIKSFIDTNKDAITLNYKTFNKNKCNEIFTPNYIKVPIRQ